MKFYVYVHKKSDTGETFYVGKGSSRYRAFSNRSRNPYWHNVVNKHGFTATIIEYYSTEEEAIATEIQLIAEYRSLGVELVNMTNGGDGTTGAKLSKETKDKISKNHSRHNLGKTLSVDTRRKLSESLRVNSRFKGKRHSPEAIAKITGIKNGFAKLSVEDALVIRDSKDKAKNLAEMYGVSLRQVVNIKAEKTWHFRN